jgi:hypothetical protein
MAEPRVVGELKHDWFHWKNQDDGSTFQQVFFG